MKKTLTLLSSAVLIFTLFWYALEVQYAGVGFAAGPQAPSPYLSIALSVVATLNIVNLYKHLRQPGRQFNRRVFILGILMLLITAVVRF